MENEEDFKEDFKINDLIKKSDEKVSLSELVSKRLDEIYTKNISEKKS